MERDEGARMGEFAVGVGSGCGFCMDLLLMWGTLVVVNVGYQLR